MGMFFGILGYFLGFQNFGPGSFFVRRFSWKKPFSIETFIPYWELDFFNIPPRAELFQSSGAVGISVIASGFSTRTSKNLGRGRF